MARSSGRLTKASTAAYSPGARKPLGILGGGQLARMLALKAHELGIAVTVLSESPLDPAAQVTSLWQKGDLSRASSLKSFLSSCSLVTFESEFLDADQLTRLARETRTPIFPQPSVMALIQDRLPQKELLLRHQLPTAEFRAVSTRADAERAFADLSGEVVFKKRRFGYDGYGTFVVRNRVDLTKFLPEIERNENGFIAEQFVPFQRELAVMVARSRNGETLHLPFVETKQENSRCLWVKGPLPKSTRLQRLGESLESFLSSIDYVGIMGVELFETGKGLLINELAPRVHNSGHYTLNALSVDQFSLHLRAIQGMGLGHPRPLAKGFAMMNLLGASSRRPAWTLPSASEINLHWYGKVENRKGRKMGHYNVLGASPDEALKLALERRSDFKV